MKRQNVPLHTKLIACALAIVLIVTSFICAFNYMSANDAGQSAHDNEFHVNGTINPRITRELPAKAYFSDIIGNVSLNHGANEKEGCRYFISSDICRDRHKDIGSEYIRVWLGSETFPYDENAAYESRYDNPTNYSALDAVIDRTREAGAKPYLCIAYCPQVWCIDRSYPAGSMNPPSEANLQRYADYIGKIANRYSEKHVEIPYWEIWNEPGGDRWYWEMNAKDKYCRVYDRVEESIRANYDFIPPKVGGPSQGNFVNAYWAIGISSWMPYILNTTGKFDFMSWHAYGGDDMSLPSDDALMGRTKELYEDDVNKARALLSNCTREENRNAELVISEYNVNWRSPVDARANTIFNSAYTASALLHMTLSKTDIEFNFDGTSDREDMNYCLGLWYRTGEPMPVFYAKKLFVSKIHKGANIARTECYAQSMEMLATCEPSSDVYSVLMINKANYQRDFDIYANDISVERVQMSIARERGITVASLAVSQVQHITLPAYGVAVVEYFGNRSGNGSSGSADDGGNGNANNQTPITLEAERFAVRDCQLLSDTAAQGGYCCALYSTGSGIADAFLLGEANNISIRARQDYYNGNARLAIELDNMRLGEITLVGNEWRWYNFFMQTSKGYHELRFEFLNDAYGGVGNDRNAYIDAVHVEPSVESNASMHEIVFREAESFSIISSSQAIIDESASAGKAIGLFSNISYIEHSFELQQGNYTLNVSAKEQFYLTHAIIRVTFDGKIMHIVIKSSTYKWYGLSLGLVNNGTHKLKLQFANDAWGGSAEFDRNAFIDSVKFEAMPPQPAQSQMQIFEAEKCIASGASILSDASASEGKCIAMYANSAKITFRCTFAQTYIFLIVNAKEDYYIAHAELDIRIDGVSKTRLQIQSTQYRTYSLRLSALQIGAHDVTIIFVNDAYGGSAYKDRNAYVDWLGLTLNYSSNATSQNASARSYEAETWSMKYFEMLTFDNQASGGKAVAFYKTGDYIKCTIILEGNDRISIRARGTNYNGAPCLQLLVDGTPSGKNYISSTYSTYEYSVNALGAHTLTFEFTNDAYGGSADKDRNAYIDTITIFHIE